MDLIGQYAEELEEVLVEDQEIETGNISQLVVYNDDVNTFDWVIDSFIEILGHTAEQAEQLSIIIHFKGKATVKTAPMNILRPKKEALVDRGISAVIETEKV
jgi:ATP-dependent Clp protease adaptor protein ClpS